MAATETRIIRHNPRFLTRIDPWAEFQDMSRMLQAAFGVPLGLSPNRSFRDLNEWAAQPDIDLFETDGTFVFRADLPGLSPEEIDIQTSGNTLRITARQEESTDEKPAEDGKDEQPEDSRTYHVRQRKERNFSFDYRLPGEIDTSKVKASYKEGVLEVQLPKSIPAVPRNVKVNVTR